jgi:DNA-binding NarL/FixJ family response regulator
MISPIRVMLADDHALVRAGYRLLLSQFPSLAIVAEAEDTDSTYHQYCACKPDVLLLDLALPGGGGLSVLRRITLRDPQAKVLVVSMYEETLYAQRALEVGAKGYLPKSADPKLLPEAIVQVARGHLYLTDAMRLALSMPSCGELTRLSPREFEIFYLAAQGLPLKEISARLHISYKTAANHLTRIKHKLGAATTAELARLAYAHKLLP